MSYSFQLGLDTFGDVTAGQNGTPYSQAHTLRDVINEALLAEQVGVDAFGVSHDRMSSATRGSNGRPRPRPLRPPIRAPPERYC